MKIVTLPILDPDEPPVLSGRVDGKRKLIRSLEALPASAAASQLVALDFRGVELATASYLSEAVLQLRDHLRLGRSSLYLIVANLAPAVEEELEDLLQRADDAILGCDLSSSSKVSNVRLLGRLDDKLESTFRLVVQKGETTASELHADSAENSSIGPTAWNNRLTTLASKSLVIETASGRLKKYRPVLEVR
jgi:hypothetical protein